MARAPVDSTQGPWDARNSFAELAVNDDGAVGREVEGVWVVCGCFHSASFRTYCKRVEVELFCYLSSANGANAEWGIESPVHHCRREISRLCSVDRDVVRHVVKYTLHSLSVIDREEGLFIAISFQVSSRGDEAEVRAGASQFINGSPNGNRVSG